MDLYVPENVIVTEKAKNYTATTEIMDRIKALNPGVNISYSDSERPVYPGAETSADRYHYMKKTLLLGVRSSPFMETFASPGRIVEPVCTMIKTGLNCSNECEYCYLQRTAIRQPFQKIPVNLESLEGEIQNELVVDPAIRSILTVCDKLSDGGLGLNKIPGGFKAAADKFRDRTSKKGKRSLSEATVVESLKNALPAMIENMGISFNGGLLNTLLKNLNLIYNNNKKFKPWFNISEYTDLLSINHISRHLDYFLGLMEKLPEVRIIFYTKSASIAPLLKYNGHDRVKLVMHIEPDRVISKYQKRTASLSERLRAIAELNRGSDGILYELQFEPIIMYPDYEEDYLDALKRALMAADYSKLTGINFGSVRYATQLIGIIKNNYPGTDLFDSSQNIIKPLKGGDKWRYSIADRVRIYSLLMGEVRKHTDVPISLGAENPEVWQLLKLSPDSLKDFYYKL